MPRRTPKKSIPSERDLEWKYGRTVTPDTAIESSSDVGHRRETQNDEPSKYLGGRGNADRDEPAGD